MRIRLSQLRQIIKEEVSRARNLYEAGGGTEGAFGEKTSPKDIQSMIDSFLKDHAAELKSAVNSAEAADLVKFFTDAERNTMLADVLGPEVDAAIDALGGEEAVHEAAIRETFGADDLANAAGGATAAGGILAVLNGMLGSGTVDQFMSMTGGAGTLAGITALGALITAIAKLAASKEFDPSKVTPD